MVIDPITPSTVYVASANRGVFKSIDGGQSWILVSTGLTNLSITSLVIDSQTPTTLYLGLQFPSGSTCGPQPNGVLKSLDEGATWNVSATGLTDSPSSLAVDPRTPSTIYAATAVYNCFFAFTSGVFKSVDQGASWRRTKTGLPDSLPGSPSALAVDPKNSTTVYANLGGRLFKTTNGGDAWSAIGAALSATVNVLALDPRTSTTLYVGTEDGVFVQDQTLIPEPPPVFPIPPATPPTQIPTLSEWAMIVLGAFLLIVGVARMRTRRL